MFSAGVPQVHDTRDYFESKFDKRLLNQHLRDAHAWVRHCRQEQKSPLDVCGERRDLFFLIQSNP